MSRIKYMGTSHVHSLLAGDDFGGRLTEALEKDVVFDRSNSWVVDSKESGLSAEALEVLLGTGDFLDVSDLKIVPANEHQKIFLGMGDVEEDGGKGKEPEAEAPASGARSGRSRNT